MITLSSLSTAQEPTVAEAEIQNASEAESMVDWLYRDLRTMAIMFRFLPGKRIDVQTLVKRFGVSRTPLCLALTRLASEGFLSRSARKGFFRKPLDPKEIFDLYELRQQMESIVLRLAMERATDEQLAELKSSVRRIAEEIANPTLDEIIAADEEFQERMCALTGNSELRNSLRNVSDHLHYVRWMNPDVQQSEILIGHCRIVDALRERDADKCFCLMAGHKERRLDQIVVMVERCYSRLHLQATQQSIDLAISGRRQPVAVAW